MTVTEALQLIEKNEHVPALNHCIAYTVHALALLKADKILGTCSMTGSNAIKAEFKYQLTYVLNNMSRWRQCKASTTTAAEIKECRAVLKKASL